MLEFFRRYQRGFFLIITFFVVISFSFFGTFNAMPTIQSDTSTAFNAVDGSRISRSDVEDMAAFISSDAQDKLQYGGAWGPNFLNDGVVTQELLETGLANLLAEKFAPILGDELQAQLAKEKKFKAYEHPRAPFISSANIWGYFAPEMAKNLATLQSQTSPYSPESFQARSSLYLSQRKFPEYMLKQIVRYQEKQYQWVKPDEALAQTDLSLFGYHSLTEWFGPRFMRLAAEFIINSAAQAKQMGYQVSKSEALADLLRNATISFNQLKDSPALSASNPRDYFNLQLQRMGIDQNRAIHLWQQVLLFRKMYQDMGSVAMVDQFVVDHLSNYSQSTVEGVIYSLPKSLQFNDFRALQKFDIYLRSVANKTRDPLALPENYLDIEKIKARTPELVQKRYQLAIAEVDKSSLEGRVSLNEMWDWQVSDANWNKLKAQVPQLGLKEANTPEERRALIDSLDTASQNKLDKLARAEVLESHPEWITQELDKKAPQQKEVTIAFKGPNENFKGLKDPTTLLSLLDTVPLKGEISGDNSDKIEAQAKLRLYSPDDEHFYRITVLKKPEQAEIVTFEQALANGVLDRLVDSYLKGYYTNNKDKAGDAYKRPDGTSKRFDEVREDIAKEYFASLLNAIRDDAVTSNIIQKDETLSPDRAASLRLFKYLRILRGKAAKDPQAIQSYIATSDQNANEQPSLASQWKLTKKQFTETRSTQNPIVDMSEALDVPIKGWSKVSTPVNGALAFFQVEGQGKDHNSTTARDKILEAHLLISNEAKQKLADELIAEMIDNHAISLDFMNASSEESMGLPGTMSEGE